MQVRYLETLSTGGSPWGQTVKADYRVSKAEQVRETSGAMDVSVSGPASGQGDGLPGQWRTDPGPLPVTHMQSL